MVKKLSENIPDMKYAKDGDAGFDLYAKERTVLLPGLQAAVASGIALEIPQGYVGLIWDKSGLSIKNGLKTLGGVVDSGYRGEVMIGMINLSDKEYVFEAGDKVAQMLIQKFEKADFEFVESLGETERGSSGFGSSGK